MIKMEDKIRASALGVPSHCSLVGGAMIKVSTGTAERFASYKDDPLTPFLARFPLCGFLPKIPLIPLC
jgi:hypothetical protein